MDEKKQQQKNIAVPWQTKKNHNGLILVLKIYFELK